MKPTKFNLFKQRLKRRCIVLSTLAASATCAWAQSSDAIIDKLVEKGILTVREANDLREEAEKNFNQAYSVKSGMPDWVSTLRFNGDFRARYDGIYFENEDPDVVDRHRFRYRLRFGVTAVMSDKLEAGLQLASSDAVSRGGGTGQGDPISNNTSFQDNGSGKFVYLYQAYGKWSPLTGPNWLGSVTVGKMANPFVFSPMVFDGDYNPEGAALQLGYVVDPHHTIGLTGAGFMLDEISAFSNDPYLLGAQLRWEANWSPKVQSSVGIAGLMIQSEEALGNSAVPNQNNGNTRIVDTVNGASAMVPAHQFKSVVADASITYTLDRMQFNTGPFPIRLFGEYIHNTDAPSRNDGYNVGVALGKAGKRGTWELIYRYERLEADAWYEEFTDSDFGAFYATARPNSGFSGYGSGTNVRGHVIRASYAPFDALTLSATLFLTELIDQNAADIASGDTKDGTARLLVDAVWKF